MVKIKTKKTMNLPQLIEWAWENDIWSRQFCISTRTGNKQVSFGKMNEVTAVHNITEDDLFTVEVEEEIDEDTVIPEMLVIGRFDGYEKVYNQKLSSFNQHLLSAYLIHDDGFMELIYDEEKGLVE